MHPQLRTALSGMERQLPVPPPFPPGIEPERRWEGGLPAGSLNVKCRKWGGLISRRVDYDLLGGGAEIVQADPMTSGAAAIRGERSQCRVCFHYVSVLRVVRPLDIVMQFHCIGIGGGDS